MTLALRYAVRSDVGLLREGNEDSAYAGPRLLAVADGMGGHAAGEVASAVAITALAGLDEDMPAAELLSALSGAVARANRTLHEMVRADPSVGGMGTTLTAMLWSGERAALCHIGDSRAYVLADGQLHQITHDHTLVQSLVDEGRITADEAATHPQRSLLLRALDGTSEADPDLTLRDVSLGDRYLLCSDGLSSVVSEETLRQTLESIDEPAAAVLRLVELAIKGGGPDNITCIVADVVDSADAPRPSKVPVLAGAASNGRTGPPMRTDSPAGRAHTLGRTAPQPVITDEVDEPLEDIHSDEPEPEDFPRRRWPVVTSLIALLLIVLIGGGYFAWRYTQDQYYVGTSNGEVVIFRGVNQQLAGIRLSHVYQGSGIPLSGVPAGDRTSVQATITATSLANAQRVVGNIREQACAPSQAELKHYQSALPAWRKLEASYQKALAAYKKSTSKHKRRPTAPGPMPTQPSVPLYCPSAPVGGP